MLDDQIFACKVSKAFYQALGLPLPAQDAPEVLIPLPDGSNFRFIPRLDKTGNALKRRMVPPNFNKHEMAKEADEHWQHLPLYGSLVPYLPRYCRTIKDMAHSYYLAKILKEAGWKRVSLDNLCVYGRCPEAPDTRLAIHLFRGKDDDDLDVSVDANPLIRLFQCRSIFSRDSIQPTFKDVIPQVGVELAPALKKIHQLGAVLGDLKQFLAVTYPDLPKTQICYQDADPCLLIAPHRKHIPGVIRVIDGNYQVEMLKPQAEDAAWVASLSRVLGANKTPQSLAGWKAEQAAERLKLASAAAPMEVEIELG